MKLKKFNEMFDPMGSWDPKHPDNQIGKETPEVSNEAPEVSKEDFKNPEYVKSLISNPETLRKALDEGLEPTAMSNILLRVCFRDNSKESFDILIDSIKNKISDKEEKLHIIKHASQYGRIDFLKEFENIGWFKEFDDNDWVSLFEWLKLSRQMNDRLDDKEKTRQFLLNLKK